MKTVWWPEDVEPMWLTEVLRAAGAIGASQVCAFEAEPVGTGQMADSVRFRLRYDVEEPGAPAGVVGKFTAADPTSRATALAMRTSEVEVRFYQQVASTLQVPVPVCHHAEVDPATAEFVLLMSDQAPARQGDQLTGCSPDDAGAALVALAGLHAPRWADPSLAGIGWLDRRSEDAHAFAEQLMPVLFAGFVDRYAERLGPEGVGVGERFMAHIGDYLRHQPGPYTVQHGDFRLDNLLFADGSDDGAADGVRGVCVVDWQTAIRGPALADTSYFLGAGLVAEDRQANERALLREYHDRLCAVGVSGYSWDDCLTDYRRYAYSGYLMAVGASMMVERTDRGDDMFMAMATRHAQQVLDLDAEELLVGCR
ncbi:MAG TPA: aminoglycoside phosphotransferase family protein [Acidimicrobiales bacterium]|nr:aminoglycoside phosphotransferase family protein [Acidimicrobiales bacterium]